MFNIFLETKRVILEPLEEKHLSLNYTKWLNDIEVSKYNSHGIFPNTMSTTQKYINSLTTSKNTIALALIDKTNSKHFGNCSLQEIDLINSHGEIAIIIGEKAFWNRGYAYEVMNIIIHHAFNKLNLHKVYLGTASDNLAMQKLALKLGMTQEGILKENIKRDGRYFDTYLYSILTHQFKTQG